MANPATTDDIVARWRPLSEAETVIAETRLADAWRKIRREVPTLEARLEEGNLDLIEDASQVMADAVIRVLQALERNGIRKGSVSIDDHARSWELDATVRAELYFTDDELASLAPVEVTDGRPRAYSVLPS